MVNFYEEVDRNFRMKFLREEVTDGGAVDGAWIWVCRLRLSLCEATCAAFYAGECLFDLENSESRDLLVEFELREF